MLNLTIHRFIPVRKLHFRSIALLCASTAALAAQGGQQGNEYLQKLDRLGRDLNQQAAELDRALEPSRLRASLLDRIPARDVQNSKLTEWIQLWRTARLGASSSGESARALARIDQEAPSILGESGAKELKRWFQENDDNVARVFARLDSIGVEMQQITMDLARESAARVIHQQQSLTKSFEEASRVAAAAEEELRQRAELLSKPLAEKLLKIREALDVETLSAAAADRWKLSREESAKLRPVLERFRESETLQKSDEERRADFNKMGSESVAILTEQRAREFEQWLSERDLNLRSALADIERVSATTRDEWKRAAESARRAGAQLGEQRAEQARLADETQQFTESVAREVNARMAASYQSLRKTAPSILLKLEMKDPEVTKQLSVLRERGRLAREAAEKELDRALRARSDALERAQSKLNDAMAAFEKSRNGGALLWEQSLQRWFVETSQTFRDLARERSIEISGRVDAIRKLWQEMDPESRARGLEERERAKMKKEREQERDELKKNRADLDQMQRELDELKRKAGE